MSQTCGNGGCRLCCCCGKRGATILFALIGLVLAAGVIVPPVYVHETDQNYGKLFPILSYGREYLEMVTVCSCTRLHSFSSIMRELC